MTLAEQLVQSWAAGNLDPSTCPSVIDYHPFVVIQNRLAPLIAAIENAAPELAVEAPTE